MPSDHARFSPSSASRWLRCPVSIKISEDWLANNPAPPSGPESEFGTLCHSIADSELRLSNPALALPVAPEIEEKIRPYINYVRETWGFISSMEADLPLSEYHSTYHSEIRLNTRIRDCWGTCDCLIMSETECWIIDLKTGRTLVSPEENDQLLIYAMGALTENPKLTRFNLVIVQATDVDNPVKTWTCGRARVLEQCRSVQHAIRIAKDLDVTGDEALSDVSARSHIHMGDHCQWCPGKLGCPAQTRAMTSVFTSTATEAPAMDLTVLTPAQKSFIILHKNQIERFMKAVVADALRNPPEGLKVVAGGSRTRWIEDTNFVLEKCAAAGIAPRLMPQTITEVKRVLKNSPLIDTLNEFLSNMTETPPGKPTLVPITDSRPAITLGTEVFTDEGESDGE